MARLLREYNLGHAGILAQVSNILKSNTDLYGAVQVISVAFEQSGKWRNAITLIRGIPKDAAALSARKGLNYPALRFFERIIKPEELLPLLEGLQSRQLAYGKECVELNNYSLNSYELLPSDNDYSDYPGYFYEAGRDAVSISQDPLIDFDSPFFPNPYHAVQNWINLRGFNLDRDSRMGSILIFLPECRAQIKSLTSSPEGLQACITRRIPSMQPLKLLGNFRTKSGNALISAPCTEDAAKVPSTDPIDSVELYLVGADSTVYDYHRESAFHSASHRRILAREPESVAVNVAVSQALASGESETAEYKPFLDPGHSKIDELIESTIAFANTKGGVVLIGVNNHCGIDGIEKEVGRLGAKDGKPLQEALINYTGTLRQKIAGAMNRTVALQFTEHKIEGHLILALMVPEGPQKPYFRLQTKTVFVRRGSNNVVADPEKDIPVLQRAAPGFGGLQFGR